MASLIFRSLFIVTFAFSISFHAFSEEYFYLAHKPTGYKISSCSSVDGSAVVTAESTRESACEQWQKIENGEYFHIRNRHSSKYIRPDTRQNGSSIVIQPSTWVGNWTQWSYETRGEGFGHLVNRATGKYIFTSANSLGEIISQQPSTWRGDYTRWMFERVNLNTSTPTSSPSPSPSPTLKPTPTVSPTPFVGAKFEPNDGAVLVFVGQDNESVGGNASYSDGYIENVGTPAGITHYVYFTEGATNGFGFTFDIGTIDGLNSETTWGAGPMCMKCYVDSMELQELVMHMSISMEFNSEDRIARGEFDHLIRELVSFLNEYSDFPFLIRIGYEFDGPWNNYDSQNYKAAFIRIVDGLRAENVENFATVMAASTMFVSRQTWDDYWPGDEYVDWIGYSYFGGFVSDTADALQLAREKSKPIFIAESAPRGSFLDNSDADQVWSSWFVPILNHVEANTDVIKAISYISADWDSQPMWRGNGWGDTRIHINPLIQQRWNEKMNDMLYINASDNPYRLINFTPSTSIQN